MNVLYRLEKVAGEYIATAAPFTERLTMSRKTPTACNLAYAERDATANAATVAPNVPPFLGTALASSCTVLALHSHTTAKRTLQSTKPSLGPVCTVTQSYIKQCQNVPQNMTRHCSVPPIDKKQKQKSHLPAPPQGTVQECSLQRYVH